MRFVAQTPGELHGTITRTACHTRPHCTQCSLKRGDPSVARMVGPASTCRHPTSCMPSREGGEEHETGCMHVAVMHPQNYRRLATRFCRREVLEGDAGSRQRKDDKTPNDTHARLRAACHACPDSKLLSPEPRPQWTSFIPVGNLFYIIYPFCKKRVK